MDIRKRKIISLTTIRRQHLNHWIEFYFRIISISATVYEFYIYIYMYVMASFNISEIVIYIVLS
jgi:hypothetical protein